MADNDITDIATNLRSNVNSAELLLAKLLTALRTRTARGIKAAQDKDKDIAAASEYFGSLQNIQDDFSRFKTDIDILFGFIL